MLLIMIFYGSIAIFSPYVAYDVFPDLTPIILYALLAGLCGFGLFLLATTPHFKNYTRGVLTKTRFTLMVLIISLGFLARLVMFQTPPILEDDWFRYLWDGAVSAENINPFKHPPAAAFEEKDLSHTDFLSDDPQIKQLNQLSTQNDYFAYKTNYPYLTTIYPAGAQLAFRIANAITPFNLNSWRLVLLFFDSLAVFLIIKLLLFHQQNILWASLYWLNPIVILEGFNSGHMDILLVPALLSCLYFTYKQKPILTGTMLGIAISIKIWPLLLIPLFIPPLIKTRLNIHNLFQHKSTIISYLIPILLCTILSLYPLLISAHHADSGLGAYSQEWHKNSFLFSVLSHLTALAGDETGIWARILIACSITLTTLIISVTNHDAKKLPAILLIIIAAMFFLAPAGYPWYSIWFLSFVPLVLAGANNKNANTYKTNQTSFYHPAFGLIILTAFLPLYYLRFPLYEAGYNWFFNSIIVPIEFGIPLLFIAFGFIRAKHIPQKEKDHG